MIFTSLHFLLFFPIVFGVYWALPHRYRWIWLLAASCYFYMAFIPAYILILFFLIAIDYVAGILIEGAQGAQRRLFLTVSILANCGTLGIFKYYNFFNGQLREFFVHAGHAYTLPDLAWILPIGLSFHTFQSLGYVIDVYRGRKAERHLGIYALYVMFFPQLVAGPIERSTHLLPQFRDHHTFDYQQAADGLKLMAWGFFQKLVIADRLAQYVSEPYRHPELFSGQALWIATICFAFQIYTDFNAYSDIAIGSASTLGFRLMKNFNAPYLATSLRDFWRRWHISLSTWFRDYVYFPMGGNRVSRAAHYRNLLIVFLLSGLWHGANWTFCVWGLIHGSFLILEDVVRTIKERFFGESGDTAPFGRVFGWVVTFYVVCLSWVYFRADSMASASQIIQRMLVATVHPFAKPWPAAIQELTSSFPEFALAASCITILLVVNVLQQRGRLRTSITQKPVPIRWAFYYACLLTLLIFGMFAEKPFIYFQF